jgi:hypothetical protein
MEQISSERPKHEPVKSRIHTPDPSKTISLGEICRQADVPCPLDIDAQTAIRVEMGSETTPTEEIVRNFPDKSFSVSTQSPLEALKLLAYEAHCWQAWETMRNLRSQTQGQRTLLT